MSRKSKTGIIAENKKIRACAVSLCASCLFSAAGCSRTYELSQPYDVYGTSIHYESPQSIDQMPADGSPGILKNTVPYFAEDLCVGEDIRRGTKQLRADTAKGAGVFCLSDGEITYSKNLYKKLYPASTTKIMTAYLAFKYGTLSDTVTVSAEAASQAADSSVCGLRAGDQLTLEELLYGLLLESGNDAADAIAEHIAGGTESFAELMNKEAAALGATHTHFTNPHGLQDKKHYTCVYDLYLMFHAALGYEEFETIIHTPEHTSSYTDAGGAAGVREWESSNRFLNGTFEVPQGVTVIGGKTGTTNDAGYCLVLYSRNAQQEPVISVVMKSTDSDSLYTLIADMTARYGN